MRLPQAIVLTLCWSLLVDLVAANPGKAQEVTPAPGRLNIIVNIESEGALNNIKTRTPHEVIVSVQDENHKPVAGALVIFTLPDQGASGSFMDGTKVFQTTSDTQGNAIAHGVRPNNVAGKFQIHVTASANGKSGDAVINQTNVLRPPSPGPGGLSAKTWIIIGAIAAGAAVGAGIAASRGGSSGTTISPGTGTVGGPHD
jgi:hypothetical protein